MNLRKNIGILAGVLVLGMSIPSLAASTSSGEAVTVCVDWDTKQVKFSKYWDKCPTRTTPLELGAMGPQGPQGEMGQQGVRGPAGPSGNSGSTFTLSDYQILDALENGVRNTGCERRWYTIIALLENVGGNIINDEFGQPIRNNDLALELGSGCTYPYEYIFDNPKIMSVSNVVYGVPESVNPAAGRDYEQYEAPNRWNVPVTSFRAEISLDPGWHLCTSSDPQYDALGLTQESYWAEPSVGEVTFAGDAFLTFYSLAPDDSQLGALAADDSRINPYFCGPDSNTASGVGYKRLSLGGVYFPVSWADVNAAE